MPNPTRSLVAPLLALALAFGAACGTPADRLEAAAPPSSTPAPSIAPGTAPPTPADEHREALRSSRSRSDAVDAERRREAIAILEKAKERAEAVARRAQEQLAPRPRPAGGDVWSALARCESGGNPRAVGGGGRYFGAFQQTSSSWARYGNGSPILEAGYGAQLAAAQRQQAAEGWGPWPHCARRLGLR